MRYFFKFRFLIIGVFVFSSVAIAGFFIFSPTVCLRGRCLKVELATTEKQRSRGLMHRTFLPETRGMLFVFPGDDFWSFWMKNTLIPLDIIWMDRDHKIIDIVHNAQPARSENPVSFAPLFRARYVLEVQGGFVEKNRIKTGDQAQFKWIFSDKSL